MKTSTVLILVQTGVLLLLFGRIIAIEKRVPVAEAKAQDTLFSEAIDVLPPSAYASNGVFYADEIQLRKIIREELAAQLESSSDSNKQTEMVAASVSANRVYEPHQRERVAQQVDYYASVGSISDTEMHELQWEIAKLDETGRKEMLGKLVRALNLGEIEGNL